MRKTIIGPKLKIFIIVLILGICLYFYFEGTLKPKNISSGGESALSSLSVSNITEKPLPPPSELQEEIGKERPLPSPSELQKEEIGKEKPIPSE